MVMTSSNISSGALGVKAADIPASTASTDDFGFSFDAPSPDDPYKEKYDTLFAMIMVLLKNLTLNPEKEQIYWPDRVSKVNAFIEKIKAIDGRQ